jgi:predicted Zn finger-like uncharacterized protein
VKFLCDQCKAKYQIADEKAAGKTVRMKCRKCGHLIEVRAAIADASGDAGPAPERSSAPPAAAPRAPARPAPPRTSALATSLTSAKPPAKPAAKPPERPGSALAGAFKSSVQREEETSAPFDMADLSPSDEWYVAINGVPVGPIRVAEVRRKAALGAVTEESLCWQEGLDEWRPVRSFPELALIVREAAASGRSSLPPSQEGSGRSSGTGHRPSVRPAAPTPAPAPAHTGGVSAPRQPPARPATSAPLAARSNVVPITSRLATAEKIEDAPDDLTRPQTSPLPEPAVHADPFANPPAPAPFQAAMATQHVGAMSPAAAASLLPTPAPEPARKAPPWMAIAMIAAACAFGVTAGIAVFFRPVAPPAPVTQGPTVPTASQPGVAIAPTATATATDTTAPEPTSTATTAKGPVAPGGHAGPAPTATDTVAAKGPLNLQGLNNGGPRPTDDLSGSGGAAPAPGSGITSAQVQQVIGLHQPGVKRSCWERNPTTKAAVNVNVSLTVNGDGTTSGVSATSDEPSVAKCVENDVRTWHFPAMGGSQPTAFSFHFIRQ